MPPRKIILGDRILGGLPKEENPEPDPKTVQQRMLIDDDHPDWPLSAFVGPHHVSSFGDALANAIVQNTPQQSPQSPEEASSPNTGWLWQSMRRLFIGIDSSRD